MTLFVERGYDAVTVADIAERADLTKRSFFNHFADKREVVFAAADVLAQRVSSALAEADPDSDALDAAVWAYRRAATMLSDYPDMARARAALIESSPELQERNLMKMASMTAQVADALTARGLSRREAMFVAHAATTVFSTAVEAWFAAPGRGIASEIDDALDDLRTALRSTARGSRRADPAPG